MFAAQQIARREARQAALNKPYDIDEVATLVTKLTAFAKLDTIQSALIPPFFDTVAKLYKIKITVYNGDTNNTEQYGNAPNSARIYYFLRWQRNLVMALVLASHATSQELAYIPLIASPTPARQPLQSAMRHGSAHTGRRVSIGAANIVKAEVDGKKLLFSAKVIDHKKQKEASSVLPKPTPITVPGTELHSRPPSRLSACRDTPFVASNDTNDSHELATILLSLSSGVTSTAPTNTSIIINDLSTTPSSSPNQGGSKRPIASSKDDNTSTTSLRNTTVDTIPCVSVPTLPSVELPASATASYNGVPSLTLIYSPIALSSNQPSHKRASIIAASSQSDEDDLRSVKRARLELDNIAESKQNVTTKFQRIQAQNQLIVSLSQCSSTKVTGIHFMIIFCAGLNQFLLQTRLL